MTTLVQRIITAIIGLPILLLLVWLGGYWFNGLVAAAAAIAGWELARMARGWGQRPAPLIVAALAALLTAPWALSDLLHDSATVVLIAGLMSVIAAVALLPSKKEDGSHSATIPTVSIALYVGLTLFHAAALSALDEGRDWIFLLLGITFATDVAAYAVGRTVGSHKLAPSISPNKTWEGAVGGVIGAIAAGVGISAWLDLHVGLLEAIIVAGILAIAGQFGDLYMSRLKRAAAVDDSGQILPGHGGILDRIDSIMWVSVGVFWWSWMT